MHADFERALARTNEVIGAALEVHRLKGPGLLESIYERCLMHELQLRGIPAVRQTAVPIEYKGLVFEETLKLDVFIDNCLIVELKAVEQLLPIHNAQLLSYMKLMDVPVGLLINFHSLYLKNGIRRLTLKGAGSNSDMAVRA